MKRLFVFIIALLAGVLLAGCDDDTDSDPDVEGYVFKVEENRILVAENISSEKFEEIKDKTVSEFREHNTSEEDKLAELMYIDYDDASKFEKGDQVEAWIDGVNDSYPKQARGKNISLKN